MAEYYMVEAFWQNAASRTQLYVRCTTHPEAARRAQALVEEGHRDCQSGDIEV
jgi:hypothetical protein